LVESQGEPDLLAIPNVSDYYSAGYENRCCDDVFPISLLIIGILYVLLISCGKITDKRYPL